jgi:hypothetical protein
MADPHRLHPCEVANSVGILSELSWLTRGMAKVKALHSQMSDLKSENFHQRSRVCCRDVPVNLRG